MAVENDGDTSNDQIADASGVEGFQHALYVAYHPWILHREPSDGF